MSDDDAAPTEVKPNATRTPLPTRRNQSLISALFVDVAPIPFASFQLRTPVLEVLQFAAETNWQDVFPVLDENDKMAGVITGNVVRLLATERELEPLAIAMDAMQPPVSVRPEDDLRTAAEVLLSQNVREVPVVDDAGTIVGFLDESEVSRAYLDVTRRQAA